MNILKSRIEKDVILVLTAPHLEVNKNKTVSKKSPVKQPQNLRSLDFCNSISLF